MTTTTTLAPFRPGAFSARRAFAGFLGRTAARVAMFAEYRRTLAELSALAEWQREDIGLAGRDLQKVAHTAVYGN